MYSIPENSMHYSNNLILDIWNYTSEKDTIHTIVPDGCQDVILKTCDRGKLSAKISPLAQSAYTIKIQKGSKLLGFRLVPGAIIEEKALQNHIGSVNELDFLKTDSWLSEYCIIQKPVQEALDCIRSGISSISQAASLMGISTRTLQRLIKKETNQTPHFWLSLVRARRCAKLLQNRMELVDIALTVGYSDQAHMNRALKKWFGSTPTQIKANKKLCSEINQIGYD